MKILKVDLLKDGGSIIFYTDEGIYFSDNRIGSKTKGRFFKDLPLEDNSNIVDESDKTTLEISKEYSKKSSSI